MKQIRRKDDDFDYIGWWNRLGRKEQSAVISDMKQLGFVVTVTGYNDLPIEQIKNAKTVHETLGAKK